MSNAFAFSPPGQPTGEPETFGAYKVTGRPTKKFGILPVLADSRHNIRFQRGKQTKEESVTCRDRRNHHRANVKLYCMHAGCAGKEWRTMDELVKAHPPHMDMVNREEIHLVFAWSEDACGVPVEGCDDCKAATLAASEKATAAARKKDPKATEVTVEAPCQKHLGGVVGMLTPHDPNVTN
jgi:hypothetical protein